MVRVIGLVIVSMATEPLARGELGMTFCRALLAAKSVSAVEMRSDDVRSRNCMGKGDDKDLEGGNFWFAVVEESTLLVGCLFGDDSCPGIAYLSRNGDLLARKSFAAFVDSRPNLLSI